MLKKRNCELEQELQRKDAELAQIKTKADKVFLSFDMFDEKLRRLEVEREALREYEKKIHIQEKEIEKKEVELKKNCVDFQRQKEVFIKSVKENGGDPSAAAAMAMIESLWSPPPQPQISSNLEEKLMSLSSRLEKLDRLDNVVIKLENLASSGSMGDRSPRPNSNSGTRTAADIKAEMEKLQTLIMDDSADKKEREAANLKIDKLFVELSNTDEHKAELRKAKEEKAKINEPLNQAALASMLQKLANIANNPDLMLRKKTNPALTLIGMERDVILGKHQSDFNNYLLGDLTEEELRAIRASLPPFRKDQKKQQEFLETLELKIEQVKGKAPSPAAPKMKKCASSITVGIRVKTTCSSMGSMNNLMSELAARRSVMIR